MNHRMNTKLYVGNLPFTTTALDLQGLFSQAGGVASIDLVTDKFTGRSRGFAFVTMATPEDAKNAVAQLHGHDLGGRNLTVSEARPPAEPPAHSRDGGERSGGFGGGPHDRHPGRR
jgi:RNA recognition motif-containing protein